MAGGQQTVLVVEDEASIVSFVSLYLKNAGYTVKTAATGNDALAQAAAQTPDLIVLDLMLPDIDGIEVTKRIRQTSDVPILMLTARDEDDRAEVDDLVHADDAKGGCCCALPERRTSAYTFLTLRSFGEYPAGGY